MKKERNGLISLWKFIFACVIVFFHGNQFYAPNENEFFLGGYIAVEYFLIVTGLFFAEKTLKESSDLSNVGKENIIQIWNKIKKILPYLTIAFVLSLITTLCRTEMKTFQMVNTIWNYLLLRQTGIQAPIIMAQLWYISAMIMSLFILYPLLRKYRENLIYIFSPLIVIFGYGYLCHNWVGLDHAYHIWNGYLYTGTIRAFCGINLGMIIYLIVEKIKNINISTIKKIFLSLLSHSLLIFILYMINFLDNSKNYDYIMLMFICISLTIFATQKNIESKILSNRFIVFLEKISMPIFLNHPFIIDIVDFIAPFYNLTLHQQSYLSVIMTILFSAIEFVIIDRIIHHENK